VTAVWIWHLVMYVLGVGSGVFLVGLARRNGTLDEIAMAHMREAAAQANERRAVDLRDVWEDTYRAEHRRAEEAVADLRETADALGDAQRELAELRSRVYREEYAQG
jgi:tRNA A58 N-methylase Trm61